MNTRLIIDKAGRVVIPNPLRKELHLEPGDALEMDSAGEQITLRPVRGTGQITKEHGVWVFYTGQPLPASATDEMLQQIRQERDLANLGECEGKGSSIPRCWCRCSMACISPITISVASTRRCASLPQW